VGKDGERGGVRLLVGWTVVWLGLPISLNRLFDRSQENCLIQVELEWTYRSLVSEGEGIMQARD
jgi:hypothetical protein